MDYFTKAKQIFDMPRPDSFMDNPSHCEECKEVEEKAQRNTLDSLTIEEAGISWASLHCFLNAQGFLYYMPAFIRLCLESSKDNSYIGSFFFALSYGQERNTILSACSEEQRAFIFEFTTWFYDNYAEVIGFWLAEDDVEQTMEIWAYNKSAQQSADAPAD